MKKNMNIKNLIKPNIRSLNAYSAKEIPCKIKLDANECPFGLAVSSSVLKSIKTNRYPDPDAKELKKIVSQNFGVKPENILLGNGSDELINYLITTFGGPVLYPVPTFSMYGIISQALGEKFIEIPLDKEFDLDTEKILNYAKKSKAKIIFLSTPNNPTGNCFSSERVLRIIDKFKGIVVVDEAYQPYASEKGFVPLMKDYKNLVIMRTVSKIGLAGLRVGFLIADPEIISIINKIRLPFNVNSYSQAIAAACLKNKKTLNGYIDKVISERERLFAELSKMKDVKPYPTEANFILFKTKNPEKIYEKLLKHGILIKNLNNVIRGCLRVTIGTSKENSIFLEALKKRIESK
jgi:histidinol-phosphate aminotransferase